MSNSVIEMKFQVSKSSAHRLDIYYLLINKSQEDIYVFDKLYRMEKGQIVLDETLVYMTIDNDILHLLKGVPRIPEGLQVEIPEIPYARILPKEQKIETTFSLGLPIVYNNPYEWIDTRETMRLSRFCFSVGYASYQKASPYTEKLLIENEELYKFSYYQIIDLQEKIRSPVQNIAIDIIKEAD